MPSVTRPLPPAKPTEEPAHGRLAAALDHLDADQRRLLDKLATLRGTHQLASQWQQYIDRPRALLYRRAGTLKEDVQGMRAMLVVPRDAVAALGDFTGQLRWRAAVTVMGVSWRRPSTPEDSGQPRLFVFDAAPLPPVLMRPVPEVHHVMGMPRLLPGWLPVPAQGASPQWQALLGSHELEGTTTLVQHLVQLARGDLHALLRLTVAERYTGDATDEQALEDLGHALLAIEAKVIEACISSFCNDLNPLVVRGCFHRRGFLVPAEYNWIAAGQRARHWEWRMDAVELFPALCTSAVPRALPGAVTRAMAKRSEGLRLLKQWTDTKPTDGALAIAQAVDDGLPLIRQLAATFKVKRATIRALRHVSAHMAPALGRLPAGWPPLLRTLDCLPPERYPNSMTQWSAFSALYLEGQAILGALACVKSAVPQHWEEAVMQPWLARAARDWTLHLERHRDAFRGVDSLAMAAEVTECLSAWFTHARVHRKRRHGIAHALTHMRIGDWQRLLNRWVALADSPAKVNPSIAVAQLSHALDNLPGANALPLPVALLDSGNLLRAEGSRMRHCIFTYWRQLPFRPYLIFAIGHDGTPDRSTALLEYRRRPSGGWTVRNVEQRAFANGQASAASQGVASDLCDLLSAPLGQAFLDAADFKRAARTDAQVEATPLLRSRRVFTFEQAQFARLRRLLEELGLSQSEVAKG